MASDLPAALSTAVAERLEGRSRRDLGDRSARISTTYRAGGGSQSAVREAGDALAYAVARMPATYAATREAIDRLIERAPDFAPASALDAGCGPGTASWAVADAFATIASITQIDRNRQFLDLARDLGRSGETEALTSARQIEADLLQIPPLAERFDLVVLSYALAELPTTAIAPLLGTLWTGCSGALLLVEPGTPEGYRRILIARETMLAAGARLLAPCPHEAPCPLTPPDWCHFSVRLARSRDHRAAKSAALSYEDEKFAYLVGVRDAHFTPADRGRILDRPDLSKIGLAAKVCRTDGTAARATIPKRAKKAFAEARRAKWGDEL